MRLMAVDMMQVRRMGMLVLHFLVAMPMAVHPGRHRKMGMRVVSIVVLVRVFVLKRLVFVGVLMQFHHMQEHTRDHQYPAADQP